MSGNPKDNANAPIVDGCEPSQIQCLDSPRLCSIEQSRHDDRAVYSNEKCLFWKIGSFKDPKALDTLDIRHDISFFRSLVLEM